MTFRFILGVAVGVAPQAQSSKTISPVDTNGSGRMVSMALSLPRQAARGAEAL